MREKQFDLKEVLKRHFDPSLDMLEKLIEQCPDEIWTPLNGSDMGKNENLFRPIGF